jgi:hypothetical protein
MYMAELSNLKPIQTKYKGYHFRSRLEARWAVFFEEMGLDWSYEVEGFQLPSGACYLPDFFVKGHKTGWDHYYEIKPKGSDYCPKVSELRSVLEANWIYKEDEDMDATYFRGAQIHQLSGDPVDVVESVCPRCKKINGLDNFDREDYSAYCNDCDQTKAYGDCWLEEDGCEIDGLKYDIVWHKGSMHTREHNKSQQSYPWVGPHLNNLEYAKLCARQARFDGSDSQ